MSRGLSHEGCLGAPRLSLEYNLLEERPISPIPIAAVGIPRKNFRLVALARLHALLLLLVSRMHGALSACSPCTQTRHFAMKEELQQISEQERLHISPTTHTAVQ